VSLFLDDPEDEESKDLCKDPEPEELEEFLDDSVDPLMMK
jgi:hypothetical protein